MNEVMYQQACALLDERREEFVRELMALVAIPSVSGEGTSDMPFGEGCFLALQEALRLGREKGLLAELYDNRVGRLALRSGPADIGLWGHLDVVPAGNGWTLSGPFEPVYRDGYVIGRGVSDNKGPTLGLLYLLACLKEAGIPLKKNFALYLGTDEEKGMEDVQHFTRYYEAPKYSIVADGPFPVCYAEKGILEARLVSVNPFTENVLEMEAGTVSNMVPDSARIVLRKTQQALSALEKLPESLSYTVEEDVIRITAKGRGGHTAHPQGTQNAIRLLTEALLAAEMLPEADLDILHFLNRVNEDVYGTTLHIRCEDDISGRLTCVGSTLCLRQGHADLGVNIRYPVKEREERLVDSIATTCAQYGFTMELVRISAPNHFPVNHPLVTGLTEVYAAHTGQSKPPFVMFGGTYARKLPNAIAFGPSFPDAPALPGKLFLPGHGGAHQADEALDVNALFDALKLYIKAIFFLDDLD